MKTATEGEENWKTAIEGEENWRESLYSGLIRFGVRVVGHCGRIALI